MFKITTLCIMGLVVKFYSSERVLNTQLMKQYIFVNASKDWFQYVAKCCQIKLKLSLAKSKPFIRLTDSLLYLKTKTMIFEKSKSNGIVRYPLGWIRGTYRMKATITFNVHRRLNLNLTFYQIAFQFRNLYDCSVGNVQVVNYSPGGPQYFKFCGIHSNLINYPDSSNVKLIISSIKTSKVQWFIRPYRLLLFYSVIDNMKIYQNTSSKYNILQGRLIWSLYLKQANIIVTSIMMKAAKYQHFKINFTTDSLIFMEIFDGPGTLSPLVFKNNENLYVTSTFQSLIQIWASVLQEDKVLYGLTYTKHQINTSKVFQVNDTNSIITPNGYGFEVWKILSSSTLNLTILSVTYNGINDPLCTNTGVSLYSLSNDSYREITTDCFFSTSTKIKKNMFSSSNDSLLVIYSYTEYGRFSISVKLSSTKCKPVEVNACALTYLCKIKHNALCTEHRKQVKHVTSSNSKKINFPVSVNAGQCYVFQIRASIDRLKGKKSRFAAECRIKFKHRNFLEKKLNIQFDIKGYFRGKFFYLIPHQLFPFKVSLNSGGTC